MIKHTVFIFRPSGWRISKPILCCTTRMGEKKPGGEEFMGSLVEIIYKW